MAMNYSPGANDTCTTRYHIFSSSFLPSAFCVLYVLYVAIVFFFFFSFSFFF